MTVASKSARAQLAVLAATALGAMPAAAADLGGDCCADLEERIAELEATTARKGNRKVKLEVSGHVNEAIIFWDDGVESNAGVYTNDNSRTRFRFKGSAKITEDVKAGYLLEIGVRGANSKRFWQDDPSAASESGLDVRHSAWYVESKSLGTVWVGRTGPAAESITEINLAQTKDVAKYSDVEDSGLGLGVRFANGNIGIRNGDGEHFSWRRLINDYGDQPGESERGNIVKYVTPEFAGFTATTGWSGNSDYWDIGLNYKGEFAGLKLAAGIAYGREDMGALDNDLVSDTLIGNCATARDGDFRIVDCEQVGGSASMMHEDTGLYATVAAGWRRDNAIRTYFDNGNVTADPDSTFWSIEAGIERKHFAIGKTTLFAQYYDFDGGSNDANDLSFDNNVNREEILASEVQMYGGGIVQGIDAAAMSVYLYYRHYEGAATLVDNAGAIITDAPGIDDLDVVVAGGIIRF